MKKNKAPKNKYFSTAQQLLEIIGKDNFTGLINCINRVRFYIKNKDSIDTSKINQLDHVIGFNWSGTELQIIVGPESYKLRETIEQLLNHNTDFEVQNQQANDNKESLWKRFIAACSGVFVPVLPIIFSAGLITGLITILSTSGVVNLTPDVEGGKIYVTDMDVWSGLLYILANSQLALITIFFCYSTVKYMKGNEIIGIVIGLMLASPFFFTQFSDAGILEKGGWDIWSVNGFSIIRIEGFHSNIISAIGVSVVYVYIDRFIKKWMPGDIDLIFRPFIGLVVIFFLAFFVLLPLLKFVETGISLAATWIYEIPYGIGGFVLGFTFQPLVFLGITWPTIMTFETPFLITNRVIPLKAFPIIEGTTIALLGSLIALYLMQPKREDKQKIVKNLPPIFLGFPDPALYGILAPKPKTFWLSNLGGGFLGMAMAWIQLTRPEIGGFGILAALAFGSDWQTILIYFGICLAGAIVNFNLIFIFYRNKKTEQKLVKHDLSWTAYYIWLKNHKTSKICYWKIRSELKQTLLTEIDNNKKVNKEFYQAYWNYEKLLSNFFHQEQKVDKLKQKNNQKTLAKITKINLNELKQTLDHQKLVLDELAMNLRKNNLETYNQFANKLVIFLENYQALVIKDQILNQTWNSINDNLIISNYETSKIVEVEKKLFYQTKKESLLKFFPKPF